MKVLKHIINITVWLLLTLYLTLIFALRFDFVQESIGSRTAKILANTLGTKVEVGKIDLGFLNRVIIDDVVVYDQKGEKMLMSSRLSARISLTALTKGKIEISSAQIFNAHINLYKPAADSPSNFQFVADALASEDTTKKSPLDLCVNSLIVRHSSVRFHQWDIPSTPGKINMRHLTITDLNSHIILKQLTNDSINLKIKRLSLKEQSGLDVNRLTAELAAGRRNARLGNFCLKLPGTRINIDKAEAKYDTDKNLSIKEGSMSYIVNVAPSQIMPADIACLTPKLKNFDIPIDITAKVNGTDRYSRVEHLGISSAQEKLSLNASAWIVHSKGTKMGIKANVREFITNAETIDFIVKNLNGEHKGIPSPIMRMGDITADGQITADNNTKLKAHFNIKTDAGNAGINGTWLSNGIISGKLNTDGMNLKKIFDNGQLGNLVADIEAKGYIKDTKAPDIAIKGLVTQFDYNGHTFNDIHTDIRCKKSGISGIINIDNPDIALNVDGNVVRRGNRHHLRINAQIDNICPKNIRLTDKYNDTCFSGGITADITGSGLNDVCGTIDLDHLKMVSADEYYHLKQLRVKSGYNDKEHYMKLAADFGTAEINGHYDYATLPKSFIKILKKYLPTMPGLPHNTGKTGNNFNISANITKSDWLKSLVKINIDLQQPASLHGVVNDATGELAIDFNCAALAYNDKPYRDTKLYITSADNMLSTNASMIKIMDNGQNMGYKLNTMAADNKLTTSLSWDNNCDKTLKMSGNINAVSQFYTNDNGQQTARIAVKKSHINMKGTQWEVEPAEIIYRKNLLTVNNFAISHDDQHLTINGVASQTPDDSLIVDLNDIDIEYVLDLVNFHSVDFSGLASGKAYIKAPFGALRGQAGIKVKGFEFEHGRMGTLNATASWNDKEKQIDIHGICNDGPDAMTFINGYVSPKRDYIDLDISAAGTYIDFMQSFTKSFAQGITGRAEGTVKLSGPLSTINLTGKLVVDGETTIKALNCKYFLRKDTVTFIPDEIELRSAPIYDIYNNKGYITGNIHHKHLTRLSYDLNVTADNLMGYDFKDFDDSSFYGTVFASGEVGIHGKSGEVRIDVDCTPQQNTVFTYNASSPDAITNQEFIHWNDITPKDSIPTGIADDITKDKDNADDEIPTDIYINFLLNCRPEATIRLLMDSHTNDYITLNGSGMIRASFYNKGAFKMFGTYLIDHGTYGITIQNIIKKNFVFNQGGTIVFGGDPYDAALDMQAVYTVNGVSLSDLSASSTFNQKNTIRVNCLMNIGGQPNNPQVSFDLDMPTMDTDEKQMVRSLINTEEEKNQQVLYLLGIGRFYPQAENNASAGQMSQTSLAMQSILSGTISGQINNLLGNILKNNNWNFGANISTGDEGWNNAEYEGLVNGRMLNNRLLFNGEFGYRDNANTSNTSFIGDFDIQYLLVPSGNLAIKVYNETNDRYFTKSSLNTQGVGFIIKRDFTNWRDLIRSKKKKQ